MVGNYYINKIIDFFKKQIVFDISLATIIFNLIYILTKPVRESSSFTFNIPPDAILLDGKTVFIDTPYLDKFKFYYYIFAFVAILFLVNDFYVRFLSSIFMKERIIKPHDVNLKKYPYDKDKFQIILGLKHKEDNLDLVGRPEWAVIEEEGLYQNILAPGTIGQGKTIAVVTQALVQLIFYGYDKPEEKLAMLCLDVKGNFYKFVHGFAKECGRWNDVVTIELGGKWRINPIHKPNLSAVELANRMRYILELFSSDTNESYWIDKAEDTITECIKIIRLYNNNYVNFEEIHNCGSNDDYRNRMIKRCQEMYDKGIFNEEQKYSFVTARNYFANEFDMLDNKAQGFIKSEITRITQPFISTKLVKDTFCPSKEEINFFGFEDVINEGKIVVWKINANKEPKIAKLVAAYLKLDFQKEIMITLEGNNPIAAKRRKAFVCDEYQEYVTKNDAEFLSQSREPKSVTLATTQSYTSLKKALKNEDITNMLLQSLVNKIWLRTDDEWTVKKVINQIGKEEKEKVSTNITESSKQSRASYSLGRILGRGKNLSSGVSIQQVKEERFDEKFLMQTLDAYKCVSFISTGKKIIRPAVVHLVPLFENRISIIDNKMVYTDDEEVIFKHIGNINVDEIESETVIGIKESDLISSEKEFSNINLSEGGLVFKDKEIDIPKDIEDKIKNIDPEIDTDTVIIEANTEKEKPEEVNNKEIERNLFDDILNM